MKQISGLRSVVTALLALPLAACTEFAPTPGAVQLSGATYPLPADYRAAVARAAASLPMGSDRTLGISQPQTMVGATAIDPRRWYVCLDGVTPPTATPPRGERYDTIAVLEPIGPPIIRHGYASPLCTDASFSPLSIPKAPEAG
jgi:hypothetical protein